MSTLTVIFTGMLIFDVGGQMVYPVDNAGHRFTVKIGEGKEQTVTRVSFANLAAGTSTFTAFPILSLQKLAGGQQLEMHRDGLKEGISVRFAGHLMGDGEHDVCHAYAEDSPSWTKVRWVVDIADGEKAAILLNNKPPAALAQGTTVYIGNENRSSGKSHVPMYKIGVRHMGEEPEIRGCDEPKWILKTPITCPPVTLQ